MSQEQLESSIKKLTKQIGEAKKKNAMNDVAALRQQRGKLAQKLAEDHDRYFFIKDGKSEFGTLEEVQEHYEDPENQKTVAVAEAVQHMFGQRTQLRSIKKKYDKMTPDEVKADVMKTLSENLDSLEKEMNKLNKSTGEPELNFDEIDKREDDDLDGIDVSSLLD